MPGMIFSRIRIKAAQICIFLFAISLLVMPSAFGREEEEPEEQEKPLEYHSQTSLSLVLTRGNNKNFSFSFDTNQTLKIQEANIFELKGRFINSESNGEKKSEVYYSHLKYDRKIGKRAYLLSFFRHERNRLAGYNYRLALSLGGGTAWIQNENIEFSSEVAFGWNNEKNTARLSGGENTNKASFISSIITNTVNYHVSDTAQFSLQEVLFLNLEEKKDFRLNSYLSLTASINSHLALKSSIQVVYEHLPVEGYKNTDFYFLSSIVFTI